MSSYSALTKRKLYINGYYVTLTYLYLLILLRSVGFFLPGKHIITIKVQVIALCWHNYRHCQLHSDCLFFLTGVAVKGSSAGIFGFPNGLKN